MKKKYSCVKKIRGLICILLMMPLVSCEQDGIDTHDIIPNTNLLELIENSTIISDTTKEKMAHCSILYSDNYVTDNIMWVSYYCDETQTVENPSFTTIYPVLCKLNVVNHHAIERFPVARANTVINNLYMGNRALYDPNMIVNKNNIQVFFMASVNNQTNLLCRTFDKEESIFRDDLQSLKLRYRINGEEKTVLLNDGGVSNCYADFAYKPNGIYHLILTRIIKSGDYYYGALCGFYGNLTGFILRSDDGIIWDLLTIQPNDIGASEAQIEIVNNIIYYIARSDRYGQCYLGKYDMMKDQWSDLEPISGSMAARPELFLYRNELYAMYNLNKPIGKHPRSCVTIQKVNMQSLKLEEKITIQYKYGIHYFSVAEYNNELYMTFSEDRHQLNNHASDIAFCRLDFMDQGNANSVETSSATLPVYPNPTSNLLYVPLSTNTGHDITLLLLDTNGRTLLERTVKDGASKI